MTARILDGAAIAEEIRAELTAEVGQFIEQSGVIYTPFKSEISEPQVSSRSEWDTGN